MSNTAWCQVVDLSLRDWLPCKARESGGLQCERSEAHEDGAHYVSEHTIMHDRWGNGYHCLSFEAPVNTVAYRSMLRATVERSTKELEELDEEVEPG